MSTKAERAKMADAWRQWEGEIVDGRFYLRQFLGASDHSAVFLVETGHLPQRAALKFLEENPTTSQEQLRRWERATKLSHPHLIRLLEAGSCQLGSANMLYVVSELAEENLAQILPNRPLSPSEAEFMLRSVLEVLAYLHGKGLVHGRLKPTNIMAVGNDLKLTSDSICAVDDKPLVNTLPAVYDPPERLTAGYSPAGDVWSLGITLIEVLTQKPSAGVGALGDPRLPETVPAPFLEIARQCLRLDPQRRWMVADVAARLLPRPPARKKSGSPGIVAVLAALLVPVMLFAGYQLLSRRPVSPLPAANVEPAETVAPQQPPSSSAERKPNESASVSEQPPSSTRTPAVSPVRSSVPTASPGPTRALREAGAVRERVFPTLPQKSRKTIQGKIRVGVTVSVDASGKVTAATLKSAGPSRYFANLALSSSRKWRFTPPTSKGEPVSSEWLLRYEFGREKTDADAAQLKPSRQE